MLKENQKNEAMSDFGSFLFEMMNEMNLHLSKQIIKYNDSGKEENFDGDKNVKPNT